MTSLLSRFRPKPIVQPVTVDSNADRPYTSDSEPAVIYDGNLAFTRVKGGNGSGATYQEAVGAPVESNSPLGYHVGWLTIIFLNVNQMIGTGIFSTPGNILKSTGSIGLALIYWAIGAIMAFAGFGTYLELASYFPNRSGSEVVYLEQAYPRPKHFFPIAFAVQSVILSFSSSKAIVLSQYVWRIAGKTPTNWEMKGVAIAAYTLAVICVVVHNKYSLWAVNILGAIKVATLVFISITGFVVLGGNVSRVPNPGVNFQNSFQGTTRNGNILSSALVSIVFSYSGYSNAFNVVNEIKNPIPSIKKHGFISVLIVSVLYILCNIAYFAAVEKHDFSQSKEIAAAVFFTRVFGSGGAETALNVLVLLSAYGNLLAVLIGQSRLIREIGRQGVLPFTPFWVSTRPFGTPLGPYLLKWAMTFLMIVAPPAGDAFQFVISLKTYPDGMFNLAMAIGVYLIRRRRNRNKIPPSEFRVWDAFLIFFNLIQVYILAMPWWPPEGGPYAGDVSFWYATYCVTGIAIMVACALYYIAWMNIIPKLRGYKIRTEILDDNGAKFHRLVKVPIPELKQWDAEHDEAGQLRQRPVADFDSELPITGLDHDAKH
ncbi:High-affinity methionine permease [Tolypocladium ophioglossoides CBS 100239]|uniref:High-affinity methionine permease n=1 Tax=Tolypocladium ophioglossoides (strain CBS 100239) TaxID=1163406 RepID=A0A0L0MX37_TOLOC|nr:High-affinity methionine permease [Tolypocladium ophioglossoides CBS 100239]